MFLVIGILAMPIMVLAQIVDGAGNTLEAIGDVEFLTEIQKFMKAIKVSGWGLAGVLALIHLIMSAIRWKRVKQYYKRIPESIRVFIPSILGAVLAILTNVSDGGTVLNAIVGGLILGPTAILNKEWAWKRILPSVGKLLAAAGKKDEKTLGPEDI